jgi:hypothetical protein
MKGLQKYTDHLIRLLTDRMPRRVAISVIVLAVTLVLAFILLPVLGSLHADTLDRNEELKSSIESVTKNLAKAKDDHAYIVENSQKYEELIHGDRLVPHTRTVATTQLQNLALKRGLTTLSYSFSAAGESAASKDTVTGGYRVQIENVDLKIGSALDTQVFEFVADMSESFPGAAVVESLSLERAPDLTPDALNAVSHGQESGLVKGAIGLSWRTAQAQDPNADKGTLPTKKGKK